MNCPTCGKEILEHPPRPCLNALFAEVMMRWKKGLWFDEKYGESVEVWIDEADVERIEVAEFKPATNIAHAIKGEDKVSEKDQVHYVTCLTHVLRHDKLGGFISLFDQIHATAHQRTRALIMWKGQKKGA